MKKGTKIGLIVAGALVLVGAGLFTGVMASKRWDFTSLSTTEYLGQKFDIYDEFDNISLNAKTYNVTFEKATDDRCTVSFFGPEGKTEDPFEARVVNKTLSIGVKEPDNWYDHLFRFSVIPSRIIVSLPEREYGSFIAKTSTGDIDVSDFNLDELHLSVSTGDIRVLQTKCAGNISIHVSTGDTMLANVTCKSITSDGSTGDITLNHVIADNLFSVERSTGHISFEDCDASDYILKTSTGAVIGSILSEKNIDATSSTGDINIPDTKAEFDGNCQVSTSTGDIEIYLK